jgi:hydrogenase maturation protein HypF
VTRWKNGDPAAVSIHIRGVVQGVGFRPHVFRLARTHDVAGWVRNGQDGVRIHAEGLPRALNAFVDDLSAHSPPAARIAAIDVEPALVVNLSAFEIRDSANAGTPTTRVAPDLCVCVDCLREMFDGGDRRFRYPYINCTNCGPRFSILRALPYDRVNTTLAGWALCSQCESEYRNPDDRRFHAQPVACPACGPQYRLLEVSGDDPPAAREIATADDAVVEAVRLLKAGRILAVKGIGGYHLTCDADNAEAVSALRERKFRKDKPFALMVRDSTNAARTIALTDVMRRLLESAAAPIVVAPAVTTLRHVAPDNHDLGVMLPYAPLHHLLFASGAPARLVMTSANRSSEPIAYEDDVALRTARGLADACLVGERPIARRMDDSIVRDGPWGPLVLRHSRGLAPAAAAALPTTRPVLALGGDLKNTVTLVVDGQAYVSQHVGDLSDADALQAFQETVHDLLSLYEVAPADLLVVHDLHPQYASSSYATSVGAAETQAVQHHRAHVASVLAERGALDRRVVGVAYDGTGYGDDGTIWGGEFFVGSVRDGFERVASLHQARLPGGDGAARFPVQAAAGFLAELDTAVDFTQPPFGFPDRYLQARALVRGGMRTFYTTSAGRLFDTVAAICGFVTPITFEGQAAMWLEHLARSADSRSLRLPWSFDGLHLDWRATLLAAIEARRRGTSPPAIARAFHRALAEATAATVDALAGAASVDTVVLSGGVFQNVLLLYDLRTALSSSGRDVWMNAVVPPNDGGLSLGQAAMTLEQRSR